MVRQLFAQLIRKDLKLVLAAECTSVAEGEATLLRETPDLAVVDWMLPDGRGFDLVRNVGRKLPGTRWLFISSNEQGHVVREAVSLRVQGFVMKRADLATLRLAISRVLAGETYYCPHSASRLVDKLVGEGGTIGADLTDREREVLRRFAMGQNPKQISAELGVSAKTVQNQLTLIKEKLGLQEPAALVRYAIKHGYAENP